MDAKKIAETVAEYLLPQFRELSSHMDRVEIRVEETGKRIDEVADMDKEQKEAEEIARECARIMNEKVAGWNRSSSRRAFPTGGQS